MHVVEIQGDRHTHSEKVNREHCGEYQHMNEHLGLTGITAGSTVESKEDVCTNGFSIFVDLNYYHQWIIDNIKEALRDCHQDSIDTRHFVPNFT